MRVEVFIIGFIKKRISISRRKDSSILSVKRMNLKSALSNLMWLQLKPLKIYLLQNKKQLMLN